MFLQLAHTKLPVYRETRAFVLACYKATLLLPPDERFNMVQQIRRAALSVHLNIAEGCSRHSQAERKRYFEISRGSVIEIDAALDVASDLEYFRMEDVALLGDKMVACFKQLSALINIHENKRD